MAYKFKTYERAPSLAYKALRLVDPEDRDSFNDRVLDLGTFKIIESEAAVLAVVEVFIRELADVSKNIAKEYRQTLNDLPSDSPRISETYKRYDEVINQLYPRCVLSYDDFSRYVGHEEAESKKLEFRAGVWDAGAKQIRLLARHRFAKLQDYGGFKKSFDGYQKYLKSANKRLYEAMQASLPALVPEEPRRTHTYITSTTKTGKTELLKALCLNYIRQPDYAGVVILDPGGDMAPQMARWMELVPTGQLVYIDPCLSKYNAPVINPFDADNLSEQDRNLLTEQIVLAIGSLVEGKLGGSLSVNMEAILYPCVRLLIDLPNTSLLDLLALMKDDEDLIEAGCKSAVPAIADFFQTEFTKLTNLKVTKQSIAIKLRNILGKGVLDKVLCGHTSIDLEKLMADRKFIVVNLAKGRLGTSESAALGTLLVSLIQAIAMKRERLKETERPMTHLIIDECQNFVTDSIKNIIRETRKFGLAVTLAQQEVGGEMPRDIESVVTKTTNVKVAGRSDASETKRTGDLVGVPAEMIAGLEAGEFYWKNGGTAPPFLLHVRSDRLSYKGGMNNDLWLQVAKQQQQFYYRNHDDRVPDIIKNDPLDDGPTEDSKRSYIFK